MAHNIEVTDGKNAGKEDGVNINGELRFGSPDFLGVILAPQPYVMASVNTAGETSYGGVGLAWDWEPAESWHIEPSFGYVIHSGKLDAKGTTADERKAYGDEYLLLGSRDLFRTSLAVTRDLGESFGVQVIFEHLSHGQVLGSGRNQGLDELGVRLVYRFD